jgi:hypothetical protein
MQKAAQIMQSQMAAANDAIVEQSSESVVAIESITEAANDVEFKSMGKRSPRESVQESVLVLLQLKKPGMVSLHSPRRKRWWLVLLSVRYLLQSV